MTYGPDIAHVATPIGTIELCGDRHRLISVTIIPDHHGPIRQPAHLDSQVAVASHHLREYFARRRTSFDVILQAASTSRGHDLRNAIASVPYGETLTYGALAQQIESGPRAIGQACRRNPFPIIIPCHRVTSANGPEHYSGGSGTDTKAWLNAFERGEIS